MGAYLPGYQHVTIIHLKELISNQRTLIKSTDVQHCTLPQFEGLFLPDLLDYARAFNHGEILRALPSIDREIHKLPREYVANIIQTLAKGDFSTWVRRRIQARNEKLASDREMGIKMD